MSSRKKQKLMAKPTEDKNIEEYGRVVKKDLQAIINKLNRQVRNDWHNGYEKQAVTAGECQDTIQEVLNVGIGKKKNLKECNELLKILSSSWNDLLEVESRVDVKTMLGETCDSLSFNVRVPWSKTPMEIATTRYGGQPEDLFAYMWNALLRTHASSSNINKELLLQCIKDASDNSGKEVTFDGPLCDPWACNNPVDDPGVPDGKALSCIIKEKESEWKALPKTYTR